MNELWNFLFSLKKITHAHTRAHTHTQRPLNWQKSVQLLTFGLVICDSKRSTRAKRPGSPGRGPEPTVRAHYRPRAGSEGS